MKIILFLLLLYFCNTDDAPNCEIRSPSKAQDCYSRTVDSENYCCYAYDFIVSEDDGPLDPKCIELPKSSSLQEKKNIIKEKIESHSVSDVKVQCKEDKNGETTTRNSSSYLKIGFLFILALLF